VLQMLRTMEDAREQLVAEDPSVANLEEATQVVDAASARAEQATVKVLVGTAADEDRFPFEGHIDFIGNTVDPSTGTIELRAVFENEDRQLFPGLFVRVRVIAVQPSERLLVSERAVGTDIGGKYLYVVGEGNVVERRYVTVGQPQPDGTIVVEEGFEPGETYISDGLLRARPGLPVTPVTEEEMAQRRAAMKSRMEGAAGDAGGKE